MTWSLETAIQQAKELPEARQQELAEIIRALIGQTVPEPVISF